MRPLFRPNAPFLQVQSQLNLWISKGLSSAHLKHTRAIMFVPLRNCNHWIANQQLILKNPYFLISDNRSLWPVFSVVQYHLYKVALHPTLKQEGKMSRHNLHTTKTDEHISVLRTQEAEAERLLQVWGQWNPATKRTIKIKWISRSHNDSLTFMVLEKDQKDPEVL